LSDNDHPFPGSITGRDYDRIVSANKYLLVTAVESYIAVKFEANVIVYRLRTLMCQLMQKLQH